MSENTTSQKKEKIVHESHIHAPVFEDTMSITYAYNELNNMYEELINNRKDTTVIERISDILKSWHIITLEMSGTMLWVQIPPSLNEQTIQESFLSRLGKFFQTGGHWSAQEYTVKQLMVTNFHLPLQFHIDSTMMQDITEGKIHHIEIALAYLCDYLDEPYTYAMKEQKEEYSQIAIFDNPNQIINANMLRQWFQELSQKEIRAIGDTIETKSLFDIVDKVTFQLKNPE